MGHPGIFVPGFGELLTTGFELFQFVGAAHPSGVATHSFPVPLQLSFMGMSSSQGLILGTPSDQTFCNALDLRIGFETPDPQPAAGFGADVTLGPAPLTVLFTDLSTGVITDWNWDFGDGSSSTQQSPGHIYSTPGTYTVGLRVTGPGGLDIERKFDHIVAQ
jgi:PKD repeat protein